MCQLRNIRCHLHDSIFTSYGALKMSYRRPLQVLVYPVRFRNNDLEFLLLKRVEKRGGFWQGVTGAPEDDEDLYEGARRELLEETGYFPHLLIQIEYTYFIDVSDVKGNVYAPGVESIPEYTFAARVDANDDPILDSEEHADWRWCTFDEAMNLLHYDNNKEALKQVQSLLVEESK